MIHSEDESGIITKLTVYSVPLTYHAVLQLHPHAIAMPPRIQVSKEMKAYYTLASLWSAGMSYHLPVYHPRDGEQ